MIVNMMIMIVNMKIMIVNMMIMIVNMMIIMITTIMILMARMIKHHGSRHGRRELRAEEFLACRLSEIGLILILIWIRVRIMRMRTIMIEIRLILIQIRILIMILMIMIMNHDSWLCWRWQQKCASYHAGVHLLLREFLSFPELWR